MTKRWVQLGIVGKAHGLNGAFFISRRDEPLPLSVKDLKIGADPDKAPSFRLLQSRPQGERLILMLRELTSREAVTVLLAQPIWCPREQLMIDETREYLWADLVGKDVHDIAGQFVGRIAEVGNFGASDVVRLLHDERGSLELPFVGQYFDMTFTASDPKLKLLLPLSHFDELWSPP